MVNGLMLKKLSVEKVAAAAVVVVAAAAVKAEEDKIDGEVAVAAIQVAPGAAAAVEPVEVTVSQLFSSIHNVQI